VRTIVLIVLICLLSVCLTAENKKRDFASITRLEAIEDVNPELYWLDNQT
jgi:hypothetical protein